MKYSYSSKYSLIFISNQMQEKYVGKQKYIFLSTALDPKECFIATHERLVETVEAKNEN